MCLFLRTKEKAKETDWRGRDDRRNGSRAPVGGQR